MSARLIDMRQAHDSPRSDAGGLRALLTPLVGEPFRFARVSYGDELTLHFGDVSAAPSGKLKGRPYGAYVLGLRASEWVLKSGSEPLVLTTGAGGGNPIRNEELEANPLIQPDGRVLSVTAFVVKPNDVFGLELRTSDGSTLLVVPPAIGMDSPADEGLPEVADWELSSPHGFLSAGPGLNWSFQPRVAK